VLVAVNASATEEYPISTNLPYEQIMIPGLGKHLGPDGWAYGTAKNGDPVDVTPTVDVPIYTFSWPNAGAYAPVSTTVHPALTDANRARNNLGVGEEVGLSFDPPLNGLPPAFVLDWKTTAGSVDSGGNFVAPSNAVKSVTVTATIRDQGVAVDFPAFNVLEPQFEAATTNGADLPDIFLPGNQGVCMRLLITVNPTIVSFYRVQAVEMSGPASAITGYMTNYTAAQLYHKTSAGWADYDDNNLREVEDHCHHEGYAPFVGGFDWIIPVPWHVGDSSVTNGFMTRTQSVRITDTLGTTTVTKMGASTTRTP
jgi:hypothetical protein